MKALSVGIICLFLAGLVQAGGMDLRPWEIVRRTLKVEGRETRPDWVELDWKAGGGPEGDVRIVSDGDGGERLLDWKVKIDHRNESKYPVGWPSIQALSESAFGDLGEKALSFRIRVKAKRGICNVRFILLRKAGSSPSLPIALRPNEWQEVVVPLKGTSPVTGLHFFLCEVEYGHGDELDFQIRDFSVGEPTKAAVPLADGLLGASLWVGERGDGDSRIVMLPSGTKALPAVLHVENRSERAIPATAIVGVRVRDVFTGKDVLREMPLGRKIPARARERVAFEIPLDGVPAGYGHVLADIRVDGVSVFGVRKGSDDFYLRRPGESEAFAMLSYRTGQTAWIVDRIHGGIFNDAKVALPHAYDPYDARPENYREFLRAFALSTAKICEGCEAGMTGLALAAEAFRRAGDRPRQDFAEGVLWNAAEAMLSMQDACGGVITVANELQADGIGRGSSSTARDCEYNSDQIAEWMRGLAYVSLHYRRRGGAAEKVKRINDACLRAGDFIVAHSVWPEAGLADVLQKYNLTRRADGTFGRAVHRQEGRQCDVYQPRLLAGLSYAAIARLKNGETVPAAWWRSFDATSAWIARKMKPNGWFDWQCADVVEGGCHTFLGNIYAGEGLFGVALANRLAGRLPECDAALATARRAYHYLTDDCVIHGRRFGAPGEFWVGPYLYWLFAEWEAHVGRDPTFARWMETMDRAWRVDRRWEDFLRLPGKGVYRSDGNGALATAILGYLGLREMADRGENWTLVD